MCYIGLVLNNIEQDLHILCIIHIANILKQLTIMLNYF